MPANREDAAALTATGEAGAAPPSPWVATGLALTAVLFIAVLDHLTGFEVSLSVFYLGPVAFAT